MINGEKGEKEWIQIQDEWTMESMANTKIYARRSGQEIRREAKKKRRDRGGGDTTVTRRG